MREHSFYENKLLEFKANPLVLQKKICDNELVQILSSNNWSIERSLNSIN